MRNEPTVFPFYGEGAGRLFTIYYDVTHEGSDRPTHAPHIMHDPHVAHSTQVVGKRNERGSYCGKNSSARVPAHHSGPGPITLRAYMWPRPGGSCRCTKVGVLFLHPFTCARVVATPRPWPPLAAQRKQNHTTTRPTPRQKHKEQRGEENSPGKALAWAASTALARALPRQLARHQQSRHPRAQEFQHHQPHWNQGLGGASVVACRSL